MTNDINHIEEQLAKYYHQLVGAVRSLRNPQLTREQQDYQRYLRDVALSWLAYYSSPNLERTEDYQQRRKTELTTSPIIS